MVPVIGREGSGNGVDLIEKELPCISIDQKVESGHTARLEYSENTTGGLLDLPGQLFRDYGRDLSRSRRHAFRLPFIALILVPEGEKLFTAERTFTDTGAAVCGAAEYRAVDLHQRGYRLLDQQLVVVAEGHFDMGDQLVSVFSPGVSDAASHVHRLDDERVAQLFRGVHNLRLILLPLRLIE